MVLKRKIQPDQLIYHTIRSMNKTAKTTLITLAIFIAIPFTCCGMPWAFFQITAPTTCRYKFSTPDGHTIPADTPSIYGLQFFAHMEGPNDFNQSYHLERGPRSLRILVFRPNDDTTTTVRVIDATAHSSRLGPLATHQNELPYEIVFDRTGTTDTNGSWESSTLMDTDPHAGDVITIKFTVKINHDGVSTEHSFTNIYTPDCNRDPYHWMPSV